MLTLELLDLARGVNKWRLLWRWTYPAASQDDPWHWHLFALCSWYVRVTTAFLGARLHRRHCQEDVRGSTGPDDDRGHVEAIGLVERAPFRVR